jgi:hypothetical protein
VAEVATPAALPVVTISIGDQEMMVDSPKLCLAKFTSSFKCPANSHKGSSYIWPEICIEPTYVKCLPSGAPLMGSEDFFCLASELGTKDPITLPQLSTSFFNKYQ